MRKTGMVRARIRPDVKQNAEAILHKLGLSTTQAITLFYRQIEIHKGLPFDVVVANETTRRTFEDTDAGRRLVVCKDAKDMFKKLGI